MRSSVREIEAIGDEAPPERDPSPEDIAILLFTSGTTGDPKAAVLRHKHLASYIIATVEFMGADEEEAALVSVPPYSRGWDVGGVEFGVCRTARGVPPRVHARGVGGDGPGGAGDRGDGACRPCSAGSSTSWSVTARGCRSAAFVLWGRADAHPGDRAGPGVAPARGFCECLRFDRDQSTIAVLGPDDHREAVGSTEPGVRRRVGFGGTAVAVVGGGDP